MSQNQHDVANDGSTAPRPENANGAGTQQQGQKPQTTDDSSEGHHGGNHGNDANDEGARAGTAQGSSHRGDLPNAESENTGGGSDKERKNQPKNTTEEKTDYKDGNAAPSAANDGGKIGDANNPV